MMWLIFTIIAIFVAVLMALPLIRRSRKPDHDRLTLNKGVYRDRINELASECDRGLITNDEFEQLEVELKQSLLEDVHIQSVHNDEIPSHRRLYLLSLVLIPILSGVMYYMMADWQSVERWQTLSDKMAESELADEKNSDWLEQLTNEELILLLRTRLHNDPQNTGGWMVLAQTLARFGAVVPAIESVEKAIATDSENIKTRLSAAQLLIGTGNQQAMELAAEQISWVLNVQPQHEGALAISGFMHFHNKQYASAIKIWEGLISSREARGQGEGKGIDMLRKQVSAAKARLSSATSSASNKSLANNNQSNSGKDKATDIKASNQAALQLTLSLSDQANSNLPNNAVVFIVVRGDDGNPAPVAVKRLSVAQLPVNLSLSDTDAMLPGRTISSMDKVEIVARVSLSGKPSASAGDWTSSAIVLAVSELEQASPLEIQIDQQVK
ncbi:c-type cytochrome biogenesis protein CcmI [Pleionea mediterranea]|uniref:Cytochrome c-type biogenesis protein CcmI n=1 Tax=Pleionea mediterranea TaxID=523701 RepID=A0A316FP40_9GAMM|nr:c-type cytochrome biogenesis protein CcmI [Pleionea mediterranea]PWK49965.1 cytochrome c-type biogenesis protein CcmI [Pleionea mediterranea]